MTKKEIMKNKKQKIIAKAVFAADLTVTPRSATPTDSIKETPNPQGKIVVKAKDAVYHGMDERGAKERAERIGGFVVIAPEPGDVKRERTGFWSFGNLNK